MTLRIGCLRDRLDLPVQGIRGGRLGVGIHHDHAVVGEDHGGVGVDLVARRGDGGIDAVRHRLQLEQVLVGGLGVGREGAAGIEMIEGLNGRDRHAGASQEFAACQ